MFCRLFEKTYGFSLFFYNQSSNLNQSKVTIFYHKILNQKFSFFFQDIIKSSDYNIGLDFDFDAWKDK